MHSAVAARDHQAPLHLIWLYLAGTFEEMDGFLVQLALHIPHTQPRNYIEADGIMAIALEVEVECLRLVVLLVIDL